MILKFMHIVLNVKRNDDKTTLISMEYKHLLAENNIHVVLFLLIIFDNDY